MKRPSDREERILYTYLVTSDSRFRSDISPHPRSTVGTLLGNIQSTKLRTPPVLRKRIHCYNHASEQKMKALCKNAGIMNEDLEKANEEVVPDLRKERDTETHSKDITYTH